MQIIARAAIAANAVGKSYSEATRTFDDYPAIIKAWLLAHRDVLSHEAWNRHIWFSRAEPYWQLYLNASSTESATEILRAAALQTLTNMSLGALLADVLIGLNSGQFERPSPSPTLRRGINYRDGPVYWSDDARSRRK